MEVTAPNIAGLTGRLANRKLTVLIVDDNEDAREMYAAALRYCGLDVETAADGRQGIDKARRFLPDAIVMDLAMPVLEGDQAAMILKADMRTRHIPIIALTADTFLGRSRAREAGFDAFCTKPCLPSDLARILVGLIQARRPARLLLDQTQESA